MATRPQNVNDADLLWLASLIAVRLVLAAGGGSAAAEVALASDEVRDAVAEAAVLEAAAVVQASQASARVLVERLGVANEVLVGLVAQLADAVTCLLDDGDQEVPR